MKSWWTRQQIDWDTVALLAVCVGSFVFAILLAAFVR